VKPERSSHSCVPGGSCGLPILLPLLCSHIHRNSTSESSFLFDAMHAPSKVHHTPTDSLPRFPKPPFPSLTKVTSRPYQKAPSQLTPSVATIVIAFHAESKCRCPHKGCKASSPNGSPGLLVRCQNSFVSLANLRCLRRPKLARGEVFKSLSKSGMRCLK
jgi:hypothetical protein